MRPLIALALASLTIASVALAVRAWAPWASTEVVIEKAPPVATPVPSTVVPSVS